MDTTLVTVTVLSMGMAAALSAIVWRMLRLERYRSNARVAALTAAARQTSPQRSYEPDDLPIGPAYADVSADPRPVVTSAMFAERERTSPWGVRFAVMAAVALAGASFVLFTLAARAQSATRRATPPATAAANVATGGPEGTTAPAGLELMSLRDARADGSLTITGLVHNPRNGKLLSRVAVTAYTFDNSGTQLASGRALIDVTALEPGNESPFVVTLPMTERVARYRIGFRDETGRVIAHVDRRQQGPLASNW